MRLNANGDLILSAVLLVILIVYTVMSLQLGMWAAGGPAPGFWPLIIALFGLPACAAIFVRSYRQTRDEKQGLAVSPKGLIYAAIIAGLTAIFCWIIVPLGYFVATFLYCFGFSFLFEFGRENKTMARKLVFSLIVAFVLTLVGFLLFQLIFDVRLPKGVTPGWFRVLKGLQFW